MNLLNTYGERYEINSEKKTIKVDTPGHLHIWRANFLYKDL